MRRTLAALVVMVGLVACSGGGQTARSTPSAVAATSPAGSPPATPTAKADPASFPKLAGTYGLLFSRQPSGEGLLHLVNADATLYASVPMLWNSSSVLCSNRLDGINTLTPVSASAGHVYFREGDAIRMVVPPSSSLEVTTVPNGTSVISFFSVSPDDQRIAVVVVDASAPTTVTTRLYVEDLLGGGHHADVYATSGTKGQNPMTLWPMGWHQGNLVLALVPACVFGPTEGPTEWHVSSALTATRVATIKGTNCKMSVWPSPAGVDCATDAGPATVYDWNGKALAVTEPGIQFTATQTELSPAGRSIYFSGSATRIVRLGPGPRATVLDHGACGWIDEDHLLSTDAVISFPSETTGNVQVTATVTPLPQTALPDPSTPQTSACAGRFPGGL